MQNIARFFKILQQDKKAGWVKWSHSVGPFTIMPLPFGVRGTNSPRLNIKRGREKWQAKPGR
jgi:hypothetical protein